MIRSRCNCSAVGQIKIFAELMLRRNHLANLMVLPIHGKNL